jgi:hypothetical protein
MTNALEDFLQKMLLSVDVPIYIREEISVCNRVHRPLTAERVHLPYVSLHMSVQLFDGKVGFKVHQVGVCVLKQTVHFVSAYKTHRICEKLVIHIAASMHVPFQRPKRPFNVHHLPIQEISLLLTFPPRLRDHVSDECSTILHLFLLQRTHYYFCAIDEGLATTSTGGLLERSISRSMTEGGRTSLSHRTPKQLMVVQRLFNRQDSIPPHKPDTIPSADKKKVELRLSQSLSFSILYTIQYR